MYMYPVDDQVALAELWAQWAAVAEDPIVVHPQQIEAEREDWLREWATSRPGETSQGERRARVPSVL